MRIDIEIVKQSCVKSLAQYIYVAETKALINCVATTQLIGTFVFAYSESSFSHDVACLVSI